MILLLGALTIGLILSILAYGVLISFRIFRFPDITAEGSFTFGASIAGILLIMRVDPLLATLAAFLCGMVAGMTTGILHTRFKIQGLISGILVMTALYSINLRVMGKSNISLLTVPTIHSYAESVAALFLRQTTTLHWLGWEVPVRELAILIQAFLLTLVIGILLFLFFRTHLGTAMRATGDNEHMVRALGVNVNTARILGLALSNGLIAMSGALLAQYQGFTDIQMGIGMFVWGIASVIIGEALVGSQQLGLRFAGAVIGSLLFRLLVAIALRWGLNPNDLKLITAIFVFIALIFPMIVKKFKAKEAVAHA
ncbi:ABC transporter permease [candidate division KSB1 bacterium]|nr:ABC transporter permease [candidate division KSB1 bacterium]